MKTLLGGGPRVGATALNGLFSFGFAVLIWAAVGARVTRTETLPVPLELEAPLDVVIEYRDPVLPPGSRPLVDVTVKGSHELLAKLSASDVRGRKRLEVDDVMLDKGGEQTVEIKDAFQTGTRGVDIIGVTPDRVRIALSRMGKAEFRVKEDLVGSAAPGFRRTGVVIEPDLVEVAGPRALLAKSAGPFRTEPIDLAGRSETFTSFRKVRTPPGLSPLDRVKVTVAIEPEPIEQEFTLPVRILTTAGGLKPRYVLEPPEAEWRQKIVLRGPADKLRALRARIDKLEGMADEPIAFIRIRGALEPGKNDEAIEVVNLPEGVTCAPVRFNFTVKESKP